ncbi:MAG: DinB family protein [Chloroflexi bacterium]|nr:DinB family protein [Chloroflexota bacterium]
MLDFDSVRNNTKTLNELTAGLTIADLRALTHESVDTITKMIAGCTDADVIFQPVDPEAHDTYAASDTDKGLAWTLGHVVVHVTASSEESAFLGAEMARGVANHGRSRYETAWETVTTMAQVRQRLEESLRMRLASLDMWPDAPDLSISYEPWPGGPSINAVSRFVLGVFHEESHYKQIADILRQTRGE